MGDKLATTIGVGCFRRSVSPALKIVVQQSYPADSS